MDKILVPTDFSNNSKPGIRFAIRMAARSKATLVFMHVIPLNTDEEKAGVKLESFILALYQSMRLEPLEVSFVVEKGFKVDISILEYAKEHPDINYICMATRGASFINKALGTNTSYLIENSPVPVMVIPKDYRVKPLNSILYATDLENLEEELALLVNYARPKGLSIDVLHFTSPSTADLEVNLTDEWETKLNYPLSFHLVKNDNTRPLLRNLQLEIKKRKPSMVCLFTQPDRTFFEKIFLSSLTEGISYKTDVPLLTFKKRKKK